MKQITNPTELGREIKGGANEIAITGDLAQRVVSIKATGDVAWAIAFGSIAIAATALIIELRGPKNPQALLCENAVTLTGGAVATALLGLSTTVDATRICVGAGNPAALKILRNEYRIKDQQFGLVLLTRG